MRNRAILLPIRPEWVAKILNGEKTIEIRKKFPKDYVGWVYLYCTKCSKKNYHLFEVIGVDEYHSSTLEYIIDYDVTDNINEDCLDGKVCCRFWCDKVEEIAYERTPNGIVNGYYHWFYTEGTDCGVLEKASCLETFELLYYLQPKKAGGEICGYAIHISKLEVFDKPRELREFWHKCEQKEKDRKCANCPIGWALWNDGHKSCEDHHIIYEAPQNYCYIESEE